MDAYNGITLETLAEIMSKEGELRTKLGQEAGRAEHLRYLSERGLTENDWVAAHNTWLARFKADPTGQLEAQFHQILAQHAQKAHFGSVRDMAQDVVEGITLEKYAQLSVLMGKPGADADAIAREHGLPSVDAWVKASGAWGAKMSADTSLALSTQFGALYQKHAGPEFAQQQLAQTAALLADANKPRDVVDAPKKDLSQPTLLANLRSASRDERWEAARWLAHQWKKNDPSTQMNLECIPVLVNIIEHHDEHTAGKAADAAEKLTRDLGQYTDEIKWSISACSKRATETLATLEAAFEPIKEQAVPERVALRARIQDYQGLIRDLEGILRKWPAKAEPTQVSAASAAPVRSAAPPAARGGGVPKALLSVPVLIVVAFVLWKTLGGARPVAATVPIAATATTAAVEPPASAAAAGAIPGAHAAGKPAAPPKAKTH